MKTDKLAKLIAQCEHRFEKLWEQSDSVMKPGKVPFRGDNKRWCAGYWGKKEPQDTFDYSDAHDADETRFYLGNMRYAAFGYGDTKEEAVEDLLKEIQKNKDNFAYDDDDKYFAKVYKLKRGPTGHFNVRI